MNPSLIVLVNGSEAAANATYYAAALGAPLPAQVVLLHCYHDPVLLVSEMAVATAALTDRNYAAAAADIQALAQGLPAPAHVMLSAQPLADAVAEAVQQHQPLLLAMGLSPEPDFLNQLLRNRMLPVLRATHCPLLLVPEAAAPAALPRRVLLALDGQPFKLSKAAKKLAPLLAAWPADYLVTHVVDGHEPVTPPRPLSLDDVRATGLVPPGATLQLHQLTDMPAAAGILRAITDTQADLVVLIARPRSFLGRQFHHSVTAGVLRRSPVPVLLVPAKAPAVPDWMPAMG